MEGVKDFIKGIGDAYHKVKGDMQSASSANEQATATGSAPLQVGNERYNITDDKGAGRIAEPVPQNNPPTTPTTS
jgi:hypothetical protein